MPESPDRATWQDNVLDFISSKILSEDSDAIKLIVKDGLGDSNRTASWKKIVQNKKYAELAKILTKTKILKQSSDIDDSAFVKHTILCLQAAAEKDFSIFEISSDVAQLEMTMIRAKQAIGNCIKHYRIEAKELEEVIRDFTPTNKNYCESEFVKQCAEYYDIDPKLFLFLYETQTNAKKTEEEYENFINENYHLLANFLITKSFASGGDFTANVETLLKKQKSFDVTTFTQISLEYEKLYDDVKALRNFLDQHQLYNDIEIDFDEILKLRPINSSDNIEDSLVKISDYMLKIEYNKRNLDQVMIRQLSTAAVDLFLYKRNDARFRAICEELYYMEFGSRVLYINLFQSEGKLEGKIATLYEAVVRVGEIDSQDHQYNYFETFKLMLLDRKLPQSASSMIEVRIESLRHDLKVAQENGLEKNIFQNYVVPISDLLNNKVNEQIVRDFLTTKALSAYLVTVPKNYRGIGFINEEYAKAIKSTAENLAKQEIDGKVDESYLTLLKLEKGSGKSTRVGLVPFGMTFEEFSRKFERLMNDSVLYANKNVKSDSGKYPYPLPYYLVRVFPSEDALREIMRRADVETSPFGIISEMVKEQVGLDESVQLLSLLQREGESSLALKQVIESIIDHPKSNLYTLSEEIIEGIFKEAPIADVFKSSRVDKQLFKAYGVDKLSLLCIAITNQISLHGSITATKLLKEKLKALPALVGTQISEEDFDLLSSGLLKRMNSVGTTLKLNV